MVKQLTLVTVMIVLLAGVFMLSTVVAQVNTPQTPWTSIYPNLFGSSGGSRMGVVLDEVKKETVEKLGLKEEYGALVTEVVKDSPAERAGLRIDDVIIGWNGTRVESAMMLRRLVSETPAGRTVKIEAMRGGQPMTVQLVTGAPESFSYSMFGASDSALAWGGSSGTFTTPFEGFDGSFEAFGGPFGGSDFGDWGDQSMTVVTKGTAGLGLQSLTPQLSKFFGVDGDAGVLVNEVKKDSPAEKAGLEAGDVIISIDGKEVDDPSDVKRALGRKNGGEAKLRVLRDKRERTITIQVEKQEGAVIRERAPRLGNLYVRPRERSVVPHARALPNVPVPPMPNVPLPDMWKRAMPRYEMGGGIRL